MPRQTIRPLPGGQVDFLSRWEFEVLGGGSAGGGKSYCLVLDALGLQYTQTLGKAAIRMPGYRAILFRRETTQLAKLLQIAQELYPHLGGKFSYGRKGDPGPSWEFETGGDDKAIIYFAHMEHESDKNNHQGQEYQFVGFDELTHFTLTQYMYLFSRCRSTIPGLTPRIRATANPEGPGLWWVKKRFVSGLQVRTTNWFVSDPEGIEANPQGLSVPPGTPDALPRVFIPLFLAQNTILTSNDPEYASRIKAMGSTMEKALLHGDWDAFGGEFFKQFNRSKEVIKPFVIPTNWNLIGSVDPGFSSPCSFGLRAIDLKGRVYRIATYYERERNPQQHAKAIKQFINECVWTQKRWPDRIVSGLDAFHHADKYAVVSHERTFADVFQDEGIYLERASTDRKNGWWAWKALMPDRYFVFGGGLNTPLLDEMSAAVADEKEPEDIEGRGNKKEIQDHALDEERYGVMAIATTTEHQTESSWTSIFPHRATEKEKTAWRPGRA